MGVQYVMVYYFDPLRIVSNLTEHCQKTVFHAIIMSESDSNIDTSILLKVSWGSQILLGGQNITVIC